MKNNRQMILGISIENAHLLKQANPNIELWIVKNADHGQAYACSKQEYENKVKDFLKENV